MPARVAAGATPEPAAVAPAVGRPPRGPHRRHAGRMGRRLARAPEHFLHAPGPASRCRALGLSAQVTSCARSRSPRSAARPTALPTACGHSGGVPGRSRPPARSAVRSAGCRSSSSPGTSGASSMASANRPAAAHRPARQATPPGMRRPLGIGPRHRLQPRLSRLIRHQALHSHK